MRQSWRFGFNSEEWVRRVFLCNLPSSKSSFEITVNLTITTKNVDIVSLTEMWLSNEIVVDLSTSAVIHWPEMIGFRGGGVPCIEMASLSQCPARDCLPQLKLEMSLNTYRSTCEDCDCRACNIRSYKLSATTPVTSIGWTSSIWLELECATLMHFQPPGCVHS